MCSNGGSPLHQLFVSCSAGSDVLQWAHSSRLTYHPGLLWRLWHFLRQRFWSLSMDRDVKAFIWACLVCAREKTSHQPPAGLLNPLDNPWHPWSHIAMDFVTGPSPSVGNNAILTVVECLSKAVHFIPLPKLPSAAKTGDLLVGHVFHLHSFPKDIASDRGPQFISHVWRAFCAALEPQ